MEFVEVEITQWSKHQPRKDIKHPKWFAMSNRILEDSKLFGMKPEEWHALVYIFSQASQQNSAKVKLNIAHAKRVCDISEKVLNSTISRLCDAGVTRTSHICTDGGTDAIRDTTLQDTTLHNTTNTVCTVATGVAPAPTEVSSPEDLTALINPKTRASWSTLYPDPDFVAREMVKMLGWCRTNPAKKPRSVRGWARFVSGWLERGWERHRKLIPTNQTANLADIDLSDIFKKPGGAA